jgi:hypothetical protein
MSAESSLSCAKLAIGIGVDWKGGLSELHDETYPAMFLTISERAYVHICNTMSGRPTTPHCGARDAADSEHEMVRHAISRQLVSDWPAHMRTIIATGRVGLAN